MTPEQHTHHSIGMTIQEFVESTRTIELKLDDRDSQAVVLAMAHLAIERPGWETYLRGIAERLDPGLAMFDEFKRTSLQPRPVTGDRTGKYTPG